MWLVHHWARAACTTAMGMNDLKKLSELPTGLAYRSRFLPG